MYDMTEEKKGKVIGNEAEEFLQKIAIKIVISLFIISVCVGTGMYYMVSD